MSSFHMNAFILLQHQLQSKFQDTEKACLEKRTKTTIVIIGNIFCKRAEIDLFVNQVFINTDKLKSALKLYSNYIK